MSEVVPVGEVRVPGLTVLAHPDIERIGERSALPGLLSCQVIHLSRLAPYFAAPGVSRRRPLMDPHLSRHPIRLEGSGTGGLVISKAGSKTRLRVDGKPLEGRRTISPEALVRGVTLLLAERVSLLLHPLDPVSVEHLPDFGLVGESAAMVALRRQIQRVADLDVPVLLRGATGTGKELVAGAIHRYSRRREKAFVAVNMAAIPASLAAAELFGVRRGAFTGSTQPRQGHFVRAHEGTLFLDEIGETPAEIQALLLRALETGELQAVGSDGVQEVDVRVLAATDAGLEEAIEAGQFRAPLLHRLSGYVLHLPPLRERLDDVGRLVVHFLSQELSRIGESWRLHAGSEAGNKPWLSASLITRLARHDWPGNVRELRNIVSQLVIANRGELRLRLTPEIETQLGGETLEPSNRTPTVSFQETETAPPFSNESAERETPVPTPSRRKYRSPEEVNEEELIEALRKHQYRLQPSAAYLGISRTSLYALIEKSTQVRKARDLGRDEIEGAREVHGEDLELMAQHLEVSRKGLRRRMTELGFR